MKRLVDDSSAKDSLIKTLRAAPSPRYALSDLIEKRCPSCGNARLHVCRYPLFVSAFFSGRLLLRCGACGLGWEPDDQLDLEDYYVNHYAREFRQDRLYEGAFHSKENPFWRRARNPILERAKRHANLVNRDGAVARVLDIGAGEGVFLSLVLAKEKFAIEHDAYGRGILQRELGVTLIEELPPVETFDAIVASHVVEHFKAAEVVEKLREVHRSLRSGGLFVVEVPAGATQLEIFEVGGRPASQRLEPHTLFFSSVALVRVLEEAGFRVLQAWSCPWTRKHYPSFAAEAETAGIKLMPGDKGQLICLATKGAT